MKKENEAEMYSKNNFPTLMLIRKSKELYVYSDAAWVMETNAEWRTAPRKRRISTRSEETSWTRKVPNPTKQEKYVARERRKRLESEQRLVEKKKWRGSEREETGGLVSR